MSSVWWVGAGVSNQITGAQWNAAIPGGSYQTTLWDFANGWSIPQAGLDSAQLALLDANDDYLLGQAEGPRAYPPPSASPASGGVQSGYAYFNAVKKVYDEFTDSGLFRAARGGNGKQGIYIPGNWGDLWGPKLAAAKAGTGLARIGVRGDSISFGYFASNPLTKSYPGLLRHDLHALYGDGGSGFNGAYHSDTVLSAAGVNANIRTAWATAVALWALTGTWTAGTAYVGCGPGGAHLTSIVAASSVTIPFRGTTLKIFTVTDGAAGTATWTYSIDGGAPVTVTDASSGGVAAVLGTNVSGLASGDHTVVITKGSGVAPLHLIGIRGSNLNGVILNNYSKPGGTGFFEFPMQAAMSPAVTAGPAGLWSGGSNDPCDLLILACGVNEANRVQTTGVTLTSAVSAGATSIAVSGYLAPGKYQIDSETFYVKRCSGTASPYSAAIYPETMTTAHSSGATVNFALVSPDEWVRNVSAAIVDLKEFNAAAEVMIVLPHVGTFNALKTYHEICQKARGVAEEYGAALVDFWTLGRNSWNYANGIGYWGNGSTTTPGIAGTDGVHLSDGGQSFMRDVLLPIIKAGV
jgi:hypothetical protein